MMLLGTTEREPLHVAGLVAAFGVAGGLAQAVAYAETAPAGPPAGAYKVDKSHASILFRVNHLGFSTYTSRFSRFDADLNFDPRALSASSVVAIIDAASLEMDGAPASCVDIVHGPQMLDAEHYPKITFRSDRVRVTAGKLIEVHGTLSLHGMTRPIVLRGSYNGGYPGFAMDPHARIGFSVHGSFKRSDFGIAFGIPAPGTTMGVGDRVDLAIEVEFSGPPSALTGPTSG